MQDIASARGVQTLIAPHVCSGKHFPLLADCGHCNPSFRFSLFPPPRAHSMARAPQPPLGRRRLWPPRTFRGGGKRTTVDRKRLRSVPSARAAVRVAQCCYGLSHNSALFDELAQCALRSRCQSVLRCCLSASGWIRAELVVVQRLPKRRFQDEM